MPLGVHVSIAGGIGNGPARAAELGCDTFQCFGGNPRGWKQKDISDEEVARFKSELKESAVAVSVIHASYLINISSPEDALYEKSITLLTEELLRAEKLGVDYVVVHMGSSRGAGSDFAIGRVAAAIRRIAAAHPGLKTELLLENTAGSGETTGARFEEVGAVIDGVGDAPIKLGFCFDTCHAFASGYPLATEEDVASLFKEMDKEIGLSRLKVIHLNDSKGALGSRKDRHDHIGEGCIGDFGPFLRHRVVGELPLILETPKKKPDDDPRNLALVRTLLASGE